MTRHSRKLEKILPSDAFIHFHTHETVAGVSVLANKAALDAGANAIDLSMAHCVVGAHASQIFFVMWHAL